MEKQVSVQCIFSNADSVLELLQQSFDLYLMRTLLAQQEYVG